MAEINYINIDCKKLDKKILEIEIKIFRFRCQRKLFLRRLRELNNREARNIKNIQKVEKEAKSCGNIISGFFIPDSLSFTVSEINCVLAAISEK